MMTSDTFFAQGAHGGGHPDETETPLICWGAGIVTPDTVVGHGKDLGITEFYNLLPKSTRRDVAQADIAPLMVNIQIHFIFVSVLSLVYIYISWVFVSVFIC